MEKLEIEVSAGELLDKISILRIKEAKIKDPQKLENIKKELSVLLKARRRSLELTPAVEKLYLELKSTNEDRWEIEDKIRECEKTKDFGPEFVKLARLVYLENDLRGKIKRKINEEAGSELMEEKSYPDYRNQSF